MSTDEGSLVLCGAAGAVDCSFSFGCRFTLTVGEKLSCGNIEGDLNTKTPASRGFPQMGSVLICLFGVILCLCVRASWLTFDSLPRGGLFLDQKVISTDIGRAGKDFSPLRPSVADIKHDFAEFVPLERTPKQVPVTDVTVSDKKLFLAEYRLNVVIRKLLPLEVVNFGQSVRFSRFNYLLF